ncbi:MAG: efflux RND transporter periplasmic adaptor subunit, partial [Gemmataceae bacterium]
MSTPTRAASILRTLVLLLAAVALAAGAYAALRYGGVADRPARYRTEALTRGRIAAVIGATGTAVPVEVVDVGAQVAGKVERFGTDLDGRPIDYRSRVGVGTVLAYIDPSLYASEVAVAQADVDLAREEANRAEADVEAADVKLAQSNRDLVRARKLAGGGGLAAADLELSQQSYETQRAAVPAARATLEKAKAAVKRAQALLDKAKTNQDYTSIKSPVEGVIIDRRVNIGQTVVSSLNAPSLFLIAKDLKKMQVWASVNEADIGRVHPGQKAAFKVDAFPDRVFEGEVAQIRLNASMTNNVVTYTVVVNTDNSDLQLLPYLTATLQFKAAARDGVIRLPNAALRYRPVVARIDPDHLAEYRAASKSRKPAAAEL